VDEDVSDPRHLGPDPASHVSVNDVGRCHAEVRLEFDMQIDVTLDPDSPSSGLGDGSDHRLAEVLPLRILYAGDLRPERRHQLCVAGDIVGFHQRHPVKG